MGMECYVVELIPHNSQLSHAKHGYEITTHNNILFDEFRFFLLSISHIKVYSGEMTNERLYERENYLEYADGKQMIEMLLHKEDGGKKLESVTFRFALCNPDTVVDILISIFKFVLTKYPMKLYDVRTQNFYEIDDPQLKNKLERAISPPKERFKIFFGGFIAPLPCGSKFFEEWNKKVNSGEVILPDEGSRGGAVV